MKTQLISARPCQFSVEITFLRLDCVAEVKSLCFQQQAFASTG
ncbi:hypothetical protein [Acinetobacter larvae]|nr:hypothetical protein [Acinetobacter larvae]